MISVSSSRRIGPACERVVGDAGEERAQPLARARRGRLRAASTSTSSSSSELAASARSRSCLVGKWLKKVFCATSARSQISETLRAPRCRAGRRAPRPPRASARAPRACGARGAWAASRSGEARQRSLGSCACRAAYHEITVECKNIFECRLRWGTPPQPRPEGGRSERRTLRPIPARWPMIIGVPKEIKTNENRVALVPAGCEALVARGPHGPRRAGRGRGQRLRRRRLHRGRRPRSLATADEVWSAGRHDREGEGADRGRVAADAQGADHLHLLPLRRRPRSSRAR